MVFYSGIKKYKRNKIEIFLFIKSIETIDLQL